MAGKLQITFAAEKATTNTIKFSEVIDPEDMLAQALVGSLYVPKRTLRDFGWQGERLVVNITAGEKVA